EIVAADPGPGAVAAARATLPDLEAAVEVLSAGPLVAAFFARVWADASTGLRQPLLDAVATFERLGLTPPAEACRALLRANGVPLPRRAAVQERVPAHLRAPGGSAR